MSEGSDRHPLEFRVPVSDDYWQEYGVPLALLVVMLSVIAVVVARDLGDGLTVGLVFVGLSAGAVLAGLAVYNLVVAALIAAER